MDLEGRVALVTGAGRRHGIGRGIVTSLAERGARIAINDVGDIATAEAVEFVDELRADGHVAHYFPADVSDPMAVEAMFDAVLERFGSLDAVCSNAGIARSEPFVETCLDHLDRVIGVNLTGAFAVGRTAARVLSEQGRGGRIVFTSSVHVQMTFPGMAVYGATKQAIRALAETLAIELAPAGITVNHVAPGWVDTALTSGLIGGDADTAAQIAATIPLGRPARPRDIGAAVAYLCSDEGSYVTGIGLRVDGGFAGGKY